MSAWKDLRHDRRAFIEEHEARKGASNGIGLTNKARGNTTAMSSEISISCDISEVTGNLLRSRFISIPVVAYCKIPFRAFHI